jgi:PhzF family phenazine biosynthesis protein
VVAPGQYLFHELDVFASGPLTGNPLAVVHDASELTDAAMQRLAAWTNFSETTFVSAPTDPAADYRVRIFTPASELPFAGHPTLGSAQAWLAAGGAPADPGTIVQECGVGLVRLRREDDRMAFAAPPLIRSGPVAGDEIDEIVRALDLDPTDVEAAAWVDNGPGWRALRLRSADAVLAARAPAGAVDGFHVGLVGPHRPGGECAVEVRAFFNDASGSVREDPVTGSLNASLAQWLLADGVLTAPYVAAQGTRVGRAGRVRVSTDDGGAVWIGGRAVVTVTGTISGIG